MFLFLLRRIIYFTIFFFFSSRRRHTRFDCDWSSDVCSSDLIMRLHSREEFQTWLAKDEEVRDELERMVGAEFGIDESSLDSLEAFLLARYRHPDEALQLNERGVLDAAARHIGLVMVLAVDGASWAIDLENENNVYYRL